MTAEVHLHFALVAPRVDAHAELLRLLQLEVVGPLVSRGLLLEFRVVTATPPSFVAESSTLLVFELLVPCPWPITDRDVLEWQRRLGPDVQLVLAPAQAPRTGDSWDTRRARSVLTQAMLQRQQQGSSIPGSSGPARRGSASQAPAAKESTGSSSWIKACMDRKGGEHMEAVIPKGAGPAPILGAVEESTGRRFRVAPRTTLLSVAMAELLSQSLPVGLRWRRAWRLAYSPRIHGVSLQTFYRRMGQEGPSLLLLQDHLGRVFGGFATSTWTRADRYFGSGESFVFKFRRRVPKPVLPLAEQTRVFGKGHGDGLVSLSADELESARGEAAKEAFQEALRVVTEWHPRVQEAAARSAREAIVAGLVTSPTEALDAVLGHPAPVQPAAGPLMSASGGDDGGTGGSGGRCDSACQEESSSHRADGGFDVTRSGISQTVAEAGEAGRSAASSSSTAPVAPPGAAVIDSGGADEEFADVDDAKSLGLQVFHWSSKDPYFQFSDGESIAMGGGTSFALYLEKDLLHGMSESSSTFDSEPLASTQNFIISDLECWVFDDPCEVKW